MHVCDIATASTKGPWRHPRRRALALGELRRTLEGPCGLTPQGLGRRGALRKDYRALRGLAAQEARDVAGEAGGLGDEVPFEVRHALDQP